MPSTVLRAKDGELFAVRHAAMSDLPLIYRTCLQTGDGVGGDATTKYLIDPDALGKRWCEPYLLLEPQFSFVLLDSSSNVCGYTLGALDTDSFNERLERQYLAQKRVQYPMPTGERSQWTAEQEVYADFHAEPSVPEATKTFRSHIHIDLMPYAQGRGLGKQLLLHLFDALRCGGSSGVHLETFAANVRALGFYRKLGMRIIARVGAELYLGMQFWSPGEQRLAAALIRTRWAQQARADLRKERHLSDWPKASAQGK
jgi:ribosomal protein S18 acetylase RimI-like enzyme